MTLAHISAQRAAPTLTYLDRATRTQARLARAGIQADPTEVADLLAVGFSPREVVGILTEAATGCDFATAIERAMA